MVRVAWAIALLLLAAVPTGQPQATVATITVLEDAANDVQATGPAPQGVPGDTFSSIDLIAVHVTEERADMLIGFEVAAWDAPDGRLSGLLMTLDFQHNGRVFRVQTESIVQPQGRDTTARSWLQSPDATGVYRNIEELFGERLDGNTFTVPVPRNLLVDDAGAAPFPGRTLAGFWAQARWFEIDGIGLGSGTPTLTTPTAVDRAPDTGEGTIAVPIQFGLLQSGHARLATNEPFRVSNGEASTFVFTIQATNLGAEDDFFEFGAQGVPSGWDVQLPRLTRIAAGQNVSLPVIARTAFAHDHGSVADFVVEMSSQADPTAVGRVQLGLNYPLIPQPAGHHNQIYLHTNAPEDTPANAAIEAAVFAAVGGTLVRSFMNTMPPEAEPRDAGVLHHGQYCRLSAMDDNDTVGGGYCWEIWLDPGLQMGLDFDPTTQGSYKIPISSLAPQPGARLQGELRYFPPGESSFGGGPSPFFDDYLVLATLDPAPRVDMLVNEQRLFEGTITATPDGDLLPYQRGGYLVLALELRVNRPDNFYLGPKLVADLQPGGSMLWPLLEYEDPVDETFAGAGLVDLVPQGPNHRLNNPGKTTLYNLTLTNTAGPKQTFDVDLLGSNRGWARLVGNPTMTLEKGESRQLQVAVAVPSDARDGERADLIVEAASTDSLDARALLRLVTTADTDAEHADEAALVPMAEAAKSPAPWTLLVVALGVALALRRRAT